METIETKEVTTTKVIHHICCDRCGKKVSDSVEYADGYYDDGRNYHIRLANPGIGGDGSCDDTYHIVLCDTCKAIIMAKQKSFNETMFKELNLDKYKE